MSSRINIVPSQAAAPDNMSNGAALPPRRPAKRNTVKQADAARDPAFAKALQLSTFEVSCFRCGLARSRCSAIQACLGRGILRQQAHRTCRVPFFPSGACHSMCFGFAPSRTALTTRMDTQPRTSSPPSATSLFCRAKQIPTVSSTPPMDALCFGLQAREDNDYPGSRAIGLACTGWYHCQTASLACAGTVVCCTTQGAPGAGF